MAQSVHTATAQPRIRAEPGGRIGGGIAPAEGPRLGNETIRNHAAFIWQVADLLRGDYKQSDYGKVILPLTVIRRFDCVLEPTKAKVLQRHQQLKGKIDNLEPVLGTRQAAVLQRLPVGLPAPAR